MLFLNDWLNIQTKQTQESYHRIKKPTFIKHDILVLFLKCLAVPEHVRYNLSTMNRWRRYSYAPHYHPTYCGPVSSTDLRQHFHSAWATGSYTIWPTASARMVLGFLNLSCWPNDVYSLPRYPRVLLLYDITWRLSCSQCTDVYSALVIFGNDALNN